MLGESLLIARARRRRSGCWLAWLIVQQGDPTGGMLPIFMLPARDVALGAALIVALGLLAGALPAVTAMHLKITDALRGGADVFNWIGQTLAVTALNLRTIPQRLGSSGVAIVGIAGVVVVLVSVLSIAAGLHRGDAAAPGRRRARS